MSEVAESQRRNIEHFIQGINSEVAMDESGPTSPDADLFHEPEVALDGDDDTLVPNARLKLRDPSDDSLHTSATGSRASTAPTTPVRNKGANGMEDTYEDIARHKIIQIAGDDMVGRKLVLFYCSRMPPSKDYDQGRLLLFLKYTLDQYVENDYTLVVFQYGLTRANRPSFNWLVQCYKELERKYKKNLKALYVVHPSNIVKMFWGIFKHIVSVKFSRKVNYIHHLYEVNELYRVDRLDIPNDVMEHEYRIVAQKGAQQAGPEKPNAVFYDDEDGSKMSKPAMNRQFGVSLQELKERSGGDPIPRVVRETSAYVKEHGLDTEGIFRRCPNALTVKQVQQQYNKGEKVDFAELLDVHIPALILKTFFRELPEPILTVELYDEMLRIHDKQDNDAMVIACKKIICEKLPEDNYIVLNHLMDLLYVVMEHSERNKMTAPNLAVVFGPNLMWPSDKAASLSALSQINSFITTLLYNYKDIFTRELSSTQHQEV